MRRQYAELLSYLAQPHLSARVRVAIVPVQTVGCIQFAKFSAKVSYPPPDGTPLPIFWPKPEGLGVYDPRFLEQPVWHILVQALAEAAQHSGPTAARFKEAIPNVMAQMKEGDGFEMVQLGAQGAAAHA